MDARLLRALVHLPCREFDRCLRLLALIVRRDYHGLNGDGDLSQRRVRLKVQGFVVVYGRIYG
jgi:hypothetical protein